MGNRVLEEKNGRVDDSGLEIRREDEGYPARLAKLSDPPKSLFVKGRIPTGPMVAIVGSRNADSSVCRFVSRLAGDLSKQGLTIISGGALGIDTAAHEGALESDGVTVAVIGSGFDFMYPEANRALFDRIGGTGALVTEYPKQQPPTKWTFPRRNRIVAAMASAVIVAQAGEKSGALITARIARELGVPLGAMPGAAGDPRNHGSHRLLREGAVMVENPADVLALVAHDREVEQLALPTFERKAISGAEPQSLSSEEIKILDFLGSRPVHIDEIIVDTGLGSGATSAAILSLEMAGLVEDRGGKNFVRVE